MVFGACHVAVFCLLGVALGGESGMKTDDLPKLVYVAGAYSADSILEMCANVRRGLDLSIEVMKLGFAVYSPWTDLLLNIRYGFELEYLYRASLGILRRSDAMIVEPDHSAGSHGTSVEIKKAAEWGIPVFFALQELEKWGLSGD